MLIDVNALIGPYPFRFLPHPDPEVFLTVMDREGIDEAWVGHLPSAFYRDPTNGNAQLLSALVPHRQKLRPVPTIRPDWPGWERAVSMAVDAGSVAVRAYPQHWQMGPHDTRMHDLAAACGERKLPIILSVRFEDLRQRSPLDVAGDLTAAAIRSLARSSASALVIVCAAGKEMIEEVHWGLTPEEQRRVLWEISWIWGPPENHFAKLIAAIGADRFAYGTHWPLRLAQNPRANLELASVDPATLGDPRRLFD